MCSVQAGMALLLLLLGRSSEGYHCSCTYVCSLERPPRLMAFRSCREWIF